MSLLDETGLDDVWLLLNRSMGAESRKKVLNALFSNTKNCTQIAKEVKLNWRTVNRHLHILMKANLVRKVNFGTRDFYKLTSKGEETLKTSSNQKSADLDKAVQ